MQSQSGSAAHWVLVSRLQTVAELGVAVAGGAAPPARTPRRRTYVKDRVRPVNINQAASVLDEVIVPRTPQ